MTKPLPSIPLTKRTWFCEELNQTFSYRAWSLGEQSILLQAATTPDAELDAEGKAARIDALRQVLSATVDADIDSLPLFVVEMLYIKVLSASNGEVVEANYGCTKVVEGEECKGVLAVEIPLEDIKIKTVEGHKDIIDLGAGYSLKMKYANLQSFDVKPDKKLTTEWVINNFAESVFDEDGEVWEMSDYGEKERLDFIFGLGGNLQVAVINDFFMKVPTMFWKTESICPKCKTKYPITITTISQLFL